MELLQTLAVDLIRSDDLRPALRRTLADLQRRPRPARRRAARDGARPGAATSASATDRAPRACSSRRSPRQTRRSCVTLRGEDGVPHAADQRQRHHLRAPRRRHRAPRELDRETLARAGVVLRHPRPRARARAPGARGRAAAGAQGDRPPAHARCCSRSRTTCARRSPPSPPRPRRCARTCRSTSARRCSAASSTRPAASCAWSTTCSTSRASRPACCIRGAPLMPVDELLYAAVDDAAAALDGQFVDVDGAAELPPVNVDETMIRQVLVNLLENASRADPDDALGLYASNDGATLRITVVDHGPGRARGRAAAHLRALLPPAPGARPRAPAPASDSPSAAASWRRTAATSTSSRRPAAARRSSSSCRRRREAALDPGRRRRADRAAGAARRARGAGLRRHGRAHGRGRARAHHERRLRSRAARPRPARHRAAST